MRTQQLIAAVRAHVQRIDRTQDLSLALARGVRADARRLAKALRHDGDDLNARCLLGRLYWYRHLARPSAWRQRDLQTAINLLAPAFLAGAESLPEPLLPHLAEASAPTAVALLGKAVDSRDADLLSETVEAWHRITRATPADHSDRALNLSNLGAALQMRFRHSGGATDLDRAVQAVEEAVGTTPVDHPNRAIYLTNLSFALRARFDHLGADADLDDAVQAVEEALDAVPADHADRPLYLSVLGGLLRARFERTDALADLDTAVQAQRHAVDTTPAGHPNRALYLSNLSHVLQARFERTDALSDVDAAIQAEQQAVDTTPVGHPDRARYLTNLSGILMVRFGRTGTEEDLKAAVTAGRQAVDATPPGHPDRALRLSNLGLALWARFGRTGTEADLDTAVQAQQQAVDTTPADHPRRATRLSSLAVSLRTRFGLTGMLADLDTAIQAEQQAVDTTPVGHPDRARYLTNLGGALLVRFERTEASTDLDRGILVTRQAVETTPVDHPDRAVRLSNLGAGLSARFESTGVRADLDAAVESIEQAVDATPADHPNRALHLSNLSRALQLRFAHTGTLAELDAAIAAGREAVDAMPADHPDRARYLTNLGDALLLRFERNGSDAEGALRAFAGAVEVVAARPSARIGAARSAAELLAESQPGRAAHLLETAVGLLPKVAPRQLQRADKQHVLRECAGLAGDAAACVLNDAAGSARPDAGSGVRNAHPAAPDARPAAHALQLLESGRVIILSQALETRSDLTDLQQRHPDLAARFVALRDRLDAADRGPAHQVITERFSDGEGAERFSDQEGTERHHLAAALDATVAEIRTHDGFTSFLLPPTAEELTAEARPGPVVVFNTSRYRSDALLLTANGITHVPLPALAVDALTEKINSFHRAVALAGDRDVAGLRRMEAQDVIHDVLEWLWDAAAEPVLHALGFDAPHTAGTPWPRVWWIPGGLLGLLPVHAAGHHRRTAAEPGNRTVMDRVVSSYTPTVRALRHARRPAPAALGAARALIAAMTTTPDEAPLPHVAAEAALVRDQLPNPFMLVEPGTLQQGPAGALAEREPTRDNVLACLSACSIAHFACHAVSDPADPSLSRLLLRDHAAAPLTVASLAPVNLDHADLAYLSACSTSLTNHPFLRDEAIHLASAFQLAGFRHVVGTLWEIHDAVAVSVAKAFYASLRTESGALDPARSALALHHSVHAMRDRLRAAPSLWAAYLHAGA